MYSLEGKEMTQKKKGREACNSSRKEEKGFPTGRGEETGKEDITESRESIS